MYQYDSRQIIPLRFQPFKTHFLVHTLCFGNNPHLKLLLLQWWLLEKVPLKEILIVLVCYVERKYLPAPNPPLQRWMSECSVTQSTYSDALNLNSPLRGYAGVLPPSPPPMPKHLLTPSCLLHCVEGLTMRCCLPVNCHGVAWFPPTAWWDSMLRNCLAALHWETLSSAGERD